jgi:outer membrane murein-binding lipoprotein Lpp
MVRTMTEAECKICGQMDAIGVNVNGVCYVCRLKEKIDRLDSDLQAEQHYVKIAEERAAIAEYRAKQAEKKLAEALRLLDDVFTNGLGDAERYEAIGKFVEEATND